MTSAEKIEAAKKQFPVGTYAYCIKNKYLFLVDERGQFIEPENKRGLLYVVPGVTDVQFVVMQPGRGWAKTEYTLTAEWMLDEATTLSFEDSVMDLEAGDSFNCAKTGISYIFTGEGHVTGYSENGIHSKNTAGGYLVYDGRLFSEPRPVKRRVRKPKPSPVICQSKVIEFESDEFSPFDHIIKGVALTMLVTLFAVIAKTIYEVLK